MLTLLNVVSAANQAKAPADIPSSSNLMKGALSAVEAVVPMTFIQRVETIWSLVFKFAASTAREASVLIGIPASNKLRPIPTYCLLVSESFPNTAPRIFAVAPKLPLTSKAKEVSENEILSISVRVSRPSSPLLSVTTI